MVDSTVVSKPLVWNSVSQSPITLLVSGFSLKTFIILINSTTLAIWVFCEVRINVRGCYAFVWHLFAANQPPQALWTGNGFVSYAQSFCWWNRLTQKKIIALSTPLLQETLSQTSSLPHKQLALTKDLYVFRIKLTCPKTHLVHSQQTGAPALSGLGAFATASPAPIGGSSAPKSSAESLVVGIGAVMAGVVGAIFTLAWVA